MSEAGNGRPVSLESFRSPSRDFGILPFWFLNGELDPDEMRFQLKELRDKGMQGVILHGRYGLEMPYIGDTYLERIGLAVEEANRLGLKTWIYDEMNWPSGTADKRVLAERPDLAQRYIECVSFEITGPWFMCLTGEDSRYLDFQRSTPVAAYAIGEDGRILDLTPNLSFHKVVPWEVPPGRWRLCYIVEKRADYYIDAMDPEATAEFLRIGYAPYLAAIGGSADGKLVGFYSDEPAMHYFLTGGDNAIVPWTRDMFRRFLDRNGYDLRPRLIDLFFDIHPDAARVRHDFYSTTTGFYSDAYYRQIREWCRDNGVVFTAHLLYEEWLRMMIRVEGNLFKHYANMDVVAVDHLYPVIGTREAPDHHVAMKVASSAAHQFGSERLICESFGGIFMDATMQRMKWIADWEFVLGVNVLNPHGFHYTLEGARKRDWPPSMFYQYPWWRYYGGFSQYMSRLSEMLTGGRHVAKVAVLWPINSMFATYRPQERTPAGDHIEFGLNVLTDVLLRLHHDFDYLDEDVLADADLSGGAVRVRDEAYEVVVIPPMTHIKLATVEALERFVGAGGAVMGAVMAPETALGPEGLVDVTDRVRALTSGGRGRFVAGGWDALAGPGPARDRVAAGLGEALGGLVVPDLELSNEELFCLHRVKDGRDLYFVTNPTSDEQSARMTVPGNVEPVLWDPSVGEERPVASSSVTDARTSFDLRLPPFGSVFVTTQPAPFARVVDANVTIQRQAGGRVYGLGAGSTGWVDVAVDGEVRRVSAEAAGTPAPLGLDGEWAFEAEDDNALVLTSWRAVPEAEGAGAEAFAADEVDASAWLEVVPGAWSYQLPAEPQQPYPIPVWYRAEFQVADVPQRLALIVDGFDGSSWTVHLNGSPIEAAPVRSRFDAQMKELDLTALVRPGRNVMAVRLVIEEPTGGIVDHLKLVGSFSVTGDGSQGWAVAEPRHAVRPDTWTQQGYPFYSGAGVYRRTVVVPDGWRGSRVFVEVPMRDDVLEVVLNGRSVGVCLWDPYVVEVTEFLEPGENEIALRVANTPVNLLSAVPRHSGLAGAPRLVAYAAYEFDLATVVPAAE